MEYVRFDEKSVVGRLIRSLGPFGFIAVDPDAVNLDDLVREGHPGKIIRVSGRPQDCIAVFAAIDAPTLGCVAGWISEEE